MSIGFLLRFCEAGRSNGGTCEGDVEKTALTASARSTRDAAGAWHYGYEKDALFDSGAAVLAELIARFQRRAAGNAHRLSGWGFRFWFWHRYRLHHQLRFGFRAGRGFRLRFLLRRGLGHRFLLRRGRSEERRVGNRL